MLEGRNQSCTTYGVFVLAWAPSSIVFSSITLLGIALKKDSMMARRSMQARSCVFYTDLFRRNFRCTFEEYCEVLRQNLFPNSADGTVTCVGDLEEEYSIFIQGYTCIEVNGIDYQVCGNLFGRGDYFQYKSLPQTSRFDFFEGLSFTIEENTVVCPESPTQVCECELFVEGQQCNSCRVCNDGNFDFDGLFVPYNVDCSNLGNGLVRTCEEDSWGGFYLAVENALPLATSTASPVATPVSDVEPSSSSELPLSALLGIIGASVAVVLAFIVAVVLYFMLSNRGSHQKKKKQELSQPNQQNDNSIAAISPANDQHEQFQIPVTAEVLMVDNGTWAQGANTSAPTYKDQMRQH